MRGLFTVIAIASVAAAQGDAITRFEPVDAFGLEYATDPWISPDGSRVVYVRTSMDIMKDRRRSTLWIASADGSWHRPLTTGTRNDSAPRWSPDGGRLAFVSSADGSTQIWVRWLDTGEEARVTQVTESPSGLAWSPDGAWLAFSMRVPSEPEAFAKLPTKPKGAEWAPPARVIDKVTWRRDGGGFVPDGYAHVFVVPAEGGTPRQLTSGEFHHRGSLSWTPDGRAIVLSANRRDDWELEPRDSELWEVDVETGAMRAITARFGPDRSPVVSPDGARIAYLGYDDERLGYHVTRLRVVRRAGGEPRELAARLDRDIASPTWSADGRWIWFRFDDRGRTKIARVSLDDRVEVLADDLGGTSIGRPYAGGSFTVSANDHFAYTRTDPTRPADVAVGAPTIAPRLVTRLNDDLLAHRDLGATEELWCESSHDGRRVQGWIVKPPDFDPSRRYPLLLEIHGGPFANYGWRFSAEIQLYAAAGYVVLYANPRGSTSYGHEFGNAIHHAYPGHDYDDLMSAVDAVIAQGYVDPQRLFVTGGSGGGVLTAWIVGKTRRFRAAVVQKPVINWYSFVLTSDGAATFSKYWFPGPPWEHADHYLARSPLSLVGQVATPTMLLTGERDWRTPITESEQYYQALKLRGVDTLLVRIPEASHGIANRPSHLIAKVAHVLEWFSRHDRE